MNKHIYQSRIYAIMKVCVELNPEENTRLEALALKLFGRVHGGKSKLIHEALIAYLDREEKPTPTATSQKEIIKNDKPPVSREGEIKRPRIADDPQLVAKIAAMIAEGKNIADIANATGYAWSTVKSYLRRGGQKSRGGG